MAVLESMTLSRRAAILGALATAVLVLAGCASDAPATTEVRAASAPARPASAVDPSTAANDATYSAWRRSPVTPTPEFAAAVEAACRADTTVGHLPLVVLDARGQGRAILVFSDGTGTGAVACVADDNGSGSVSATARDVPGSAKAAVPTAGHMGVHDLFVVGNGATRYSVLVGQYGPEGVKNVAANFDADAAWYTAASDHGWYAIWWPGLARPLGVATSSRRNEVIDSYAP